ncbi:MAG: DUF935 domain-containing protein, partial [Desulfovibrio sp.]|nr:DUF935 domain-containing protein [Desulfovibrio sp.]
MLCCLLALLSMGVFFLNSLPPEDPDADAILSGGLTPEELAATGEDAPEGDALDQDLSLALEEEEKGRHAGLIGTGDTAGGLLQTWLPPKDVHALLAACEPVYSLDRIRAGQPYLVHMDGDVLTRFEYEIDGDRKLVVSRPDGTFAVALEVIAY